MGHVCCMGVIMGLCLVFYVFFCKPVDVVEGIFLRACCFDGGVCIVGVGGGCFLARTSTCSLPIIPAWDFTLKKWMGDGDWRIALAMD